MRIIPGWIYPLLVAIAGCGQSETERPAVEIDRVVGQAPSAVRGVPSVILFEPEEAPVAPPTLVPAVMDQVGMAFDPLVLVVPPGQTVEFRNSEDVAHNVRITRMATDSVLFNVSTEQGAPYRHTLDQFGGYDVLCDIHPGMWASILVDAAPYHVVAGNDGSFVIEGLPPGAYSLRVWSKDVALRTERRVVVTSGRTEIGSLESGG